MLSQYKVFCLWLPSVSMSLLYSCPLAHFAISIQSPTVCVLWLLYKWTLHHTHTHMHLHSNTQLPFIDWILCWSACTLTATLSRINWWICNHHYFVNPVLQHLILTIFTCLIPQLLLLLLLLSFCFVILLINPLCTLIGSINTLSYSQACTTNTHVFQTPSWIPLSCVAARSLVAFFLLSVHLLASPLKILAPFFVMIFLFFFCKMSVPCFLFDTFPSCSS